MIKVYAYPSLDRSLFWPGSDKIDLYNFKNWMDIISPSVETVKLVSTTKPEQLLDFFSDMDNPYFSKNPNFTFSVNTGYLDETKTFYGTMIGFNYDKNAFEEIARLVFSKLNPVTVSDLMFVFESPEIQTSIVEEFSYVKFLQTQVPT